MARYKDNYPTFWGYLFKSHSWFTWHNGANGTLEPRGDKLVGKRRNEGLLPFLKAWFKLEARYFKGYWGGVHDRYIGTRKLYD